MLALCLLLLAACSAAPQSATPPELTGQAAEAVQAANGLVVVRAEQFQANKPRGNHSWKTQQDTNSPTGTALVASPDINFGVYSAPTLTSPQLDYRVRFVKAGTHYIWVYGQAPAQATLSGDSLHMGLNGQAPASSSRIGDFKRSYGWINLKMAGGPATLQIPQPGVYTLNVWMREDGARFSAVALSSDAGFRPSQATVPGPAPSPALIPPPTETSLPASTISPVKARPADSFIDSVGVNTHLHYTDTVYGLKYETIIKPKLLASGIRHVRDGAYTYQAASRNSFYYTRIRELGAAGLRFNLLTNMNTSYSTTTNFSLLDDIVSWTDGAVTSFEGVNEPDIQGISNWALQTRAVQQSLYETVKREPGLRNIEVLGPSIIKDQAVLGDLSSLMDYGNSHAYSGGNMPLLTGYGSLQYNLDKASEISAADPIVVTEVGYHNALKSSGTHLPASEEVSAIYIPRLLLAFHNKGVKRSYLYEFIDSRSDPSLTDQEASFGLLRNDGSEKPAYVAVKTLLNLLKDSGGSFAAESLRLELTGQTQNVQKTLLQKRDGTFYLALWVEEESWDRNTRRTLSVTNRTVRIQIGDPVGPITRYTFGTDGKAPASALTLDRGGLDLSINDKVTLIAFAPPTR